MCAVTAELLDYGISVLATKYSSNVCVVQRLSTATEFLPGTSWYLTSMFTKTSLLPHRLEGLGCLHRQSCVISMAGAGGGGGVDGRVGNLLLLDLFFFAVLREEGSGTDLSSPLQLLAIDCTLCTHLL